MSAAPFPYFGGKQRIANTIVELLPPHDLYLEPYFGSGSLLLAKPTARFEIVNDLDQQLITFFRVLRARPGELERACRLTPHARAELYQARQPITELLHQMGDQGAWGSQGSGGSRGSGGEMGSWRSKGSLERLPPLVELEIARRVFVQLTQGRGGALASNTGWRTYRTGSTSMTAVLQGYCDRLASVAARLAEVSIECKDALNLIAEYGNDPKSVIVCDPPYPMESRSQKHSGFRYHVEADQPHHRQLAETLHNIKSKAIIFTYPNPLYDALYGSWNRIEIAATNGGGKPATEIAYLNYQPPTELTLLDLI